MNRYAIYTHTNLGFFQMGAAAAAPYIAYFVFINIGGVIADRVRTAGILSTTNIRKAAMIIG